MAKAVVARAKELAIPETDPDEFSYTPERGVRVTYRGEEILVGGRALLTQHGMTSIPLNGNGKDGASEIYVARAGQLLGSIGIADVLRPEAKNADTDCPLNTKRIVVGQITICRGCGCGNIERGLPEVPMEWLKSEWRKRGLLKRVQLTISGCVGPCELPKVVVITSSSGTEWLGNIVKFDQFRSLLEWAVRCRDAGEMLALPREFHDYRISPFLS